MQAPLAQLNRGNFQKRPKFMEPDNPASARLRQVEIHRVLPFVKKVKARLASR